MFAPGTLLWTGAPPVFCYSISSPLFAQRLGAIIGTNTQHYSDLCTHAQAQKTSAGKCAQGAHACPPAVSLQTHNRFLCLRRDAVPCVVLSGALRPLTAGSISERCNSAGKVQENKSVSATAPLFTLCPPPPFIYQTSSRKGCASS